MQKWEYLCLHVEQDMVMVINGEEVGNYKTRKHYDPVGEPVWVALNRLGREGWILVTDSIPGSSFDRRITLRRALQDGE